MEDNDKEIIAAVLRGERTAFRTLVQRHGLSVQRVVARMVGKPEDVEELVQDVLVRAYQALHTFDSSRASLRTWLCRIAYNAAVSHLRANAKSADLLRAEYNEEALSRLDASDVASQPEVDAVLDEADADRLSLLREAIELLPATDQQLLQLRYTDEMTMNEIAYVTDHRPDYVATRLARLRQRIYHYIIDNEQHGKQQS